MYKFLTQKFNLYLILIILLGIFLTSFNLGSVPNGFHWDESANGYSAYSILKSGKDEWGINWPLFIKSFGDYKSAFLSYAIIPFFIIGGVNETMARLPSVILAIIGVLGLIKFIQPKADKLSLVTGLILVTNPWFLHYSRIAFEQMPSLGLMLMGLWFWTVKNKKLNILGAILLLMSMYVYHSARLFVPVLIFIYQIIFYKKEFWKQILKQKTPWMILVIGSILILYNAIFSFGGERAKTVFFWNSTEITSATEEGIYRNRILNYPFVRIFNNKGWYVINQLGKKYTSHFSPEYLLPSNNQTAAFSFSIHGNFYLFLVPFLIIGIFSTKNRNNMYWFFISWLLISPIPSTLTSGDTNPNRSLIMIPALCFFAAKGIIDSISWIKIKTKSYTFTLFYKIGIILILGLNFGLYFHDWLIYFPEMSEPYWHGFYKEASTEIWNNRHNYDKIYFTNTDTQPYIFFSWYNQIDPSLVQFQANNRDEKTLEGIKQLDNVYFWAVKNNTAPCYLIEKNVLVVASSNDVDAIPIEQFKPDRIYTHHNRFHPEKIALRAWESKNISLEKKTVLLELCKKAKLN